jgi:hypothetical protein
MGRAALARGALAGILAVACRSLVRISGRAAKRPRSGQPDLRRDPSGHRSVRAAAKAGVDNNAEAGVDNNAEAGVDNNAEAGVDNNADNVADNNAEIRQP